MESTTKTCTALNLSDESRCEETATSFNGLFCSFHARQCQGLYRGYKIRNARLDALEHRVPQYLIKHPKSIVNNYFQDLDDEKVLQQLSGFLHEKYALLERVIRARKIHHSRFYSSNLDYGHQNYLDHLQSQAYVVLRAMERLERRFAEVKLDKRQCLEWIRCLQDTEEAQRESEKKKVKLEAAVFKRHEKEMQRRVKELKAKENLKRQEEALDEAYHEQLSQQAREDLEAEWDPIEDVMEAERETYVNLIRLFLSMEEQQPDANMTEEVLLGAQDPPQSMVSLAAGESQSTKHPKTKSKKPKKQASNQPSIDTNQTASKPGFETASQIRARLKHGMPLKWSAGPHLAGTLVNPIELHDKTAPFKDEEIEILLAQLKEIKLLLLCRLLLGQASILRASIEAPSVDGFLATPDLNVSDLRDIILKLENPGPQEIRDACADFERSESEVLDNGDLILEEADGKVKDQKKSQVEEILSARVGVQQNEKWTSKREKQMERDENARLQEIPLPLREAFDRFDEGTMIDFGAASTSEKTGSKKVAVKVCGRRIYNYPSEKVVSRGGWLHFSLLAKDSKVEDAVGLCRNWEEFWELNILSIFHYFPAANWMLWRGEQLKQQLLLMGFVPYFQFAQADRTSVSNQTGSRGQDRRAHQIIEFRNFICAHLNRNDPSCRRFLQYLSMESKRVVMLIRDAKTGKILFQPSTTSDAGTWLARKKIGFGRASKNKWEVMKEVGPEFFDDIDKHRDWSFSFPDYYDVTVWDLEPGQHYYSLYEAIHDTLVKSIRCHTLNDLYRPAASVLQSLAREPDTLRTRDIRPGEESLWDTLVQGHTAFYDLHGHLQDSPQEFLYSEADALEDAILFPNDEPDEKFQAMADATIADPEFGNPSWLRFVYDLDTDEESNIDEEEDTKPPEEDGDTDGSWEDAEPSDGSDSESVDRSAAKALLREIELSQKDDPEEARDRAILSDFGDPPEENETNVDLKFRVWMDREKSKGFKKMFHAGDLSPGAQERRKAASEIIEAMTDFNVLYTPLRWVRDLQFLDYHPYKNRTTTRDIEHARAMITLFFDTEKFLTALVGRQFSKSLLLDQETRAQSGPPQIRSSLSNATIPSSHWDGYEKLKEDGTKFRNFPTAWEKVVRPAIAKLYKARVIGSAYLPMLYIPGQAIMAQETGKDPDLYFDFRATMEDDFRFDGPQEIPMSSEELRHHAHTFAQKNPPARFAILRLWSAPHFYPLMLRSDNRQMTSFNDLLGRAFEWKFVPKDMPFSEHSIQLSAKKRIEPFKKQLGQNVIVKRDLFLVMGADEKELLKLAVATTFAIQTEPWRLEVDLWRSFVNVSIDFIDKLADVWLD